MQFGLSAALFESAYQAYTSGRLVDAELYVRQALQADPRHPDSLHLLGIIVGATNQPQDSLELFDAAIAESPKFASAHANRGVALLALGRQDEALASYRTALEIDPGHVHGNYALANLLDALGDQPGAEACLRKVLAAAPNYVEARSNLGRILRMQGRLQESQEQ